MHTKKSLGFTALIKGISKWVSNLSGPRESYRIKYSIHDTILSGLACMFTQCPSLLEFQRRLEKKFKRSNLQTQFKIHDIPKDSQMREVLDEVPEEAFRPIFKEFLTRMQRSKWLAKYVFEANSYLLAIDGTQYFSSTSISCDQCLTKTNRDGSITYSHKVVQPVIVHPDYKQIIPLFPEEIHNEDGTTKQDCEINAAKRLMLKLKEMHPRLPFIRVADSLYATTPFIREILEQGDHFLFTIKKGDHATLFDNLKEREYLRHDEVDKKGSKFIYEWCDNVPLTADPDAIGVNVIRLRIVTTNAAGNNTVNYVGTWITDLAVHQGNVIKLTKGVRCRWKIENECFNTLKNQGYEIEHNFGHGKKHLCFNMYLLTVLAFYIHQILDLCDKLFQAVRQQWGTLKGTWVAIQTCFNLLVYDSWEAMMDHLLDPESYCFLKMVPDG